jgi:tetratricopeptide (TPR) repeat protein
MNYIYSNLAKLIAGCYLLILCSTTQAQSNLEQGWMALLKNDPQTAKNKLAEALNHPKEKQQALLWLTLLSENIPPAGDSFKHFQEFLKNEPNQAPYIFALWGSSAVSGGHGKKTPELLNFLQKVANRSDFDGSLRAMAYSLIGNHYETTKQKAEAEKAYSKIGAIENWSIVGEFENISGSGFDKSYETLKKPQLDAVFPNRYGAPVSWHTPSVTRKDKWFDFTYYGNPYESVVFAQSFVNSATEQEVQLRAGVSGSLKVWLNDQLIISVPEERNNDLDTYLSSAKLHQGYNRLLVQVGESYAGRSNFLVRITDTKGEPISNLSSTAKPQTYAAENAYSPEPSILFAEDFFLNKIKQDPKDILNYILLAKIYLRSDKVDESRHTLETAKQQFPNSTFLNIMMIELYARNQNKTLLESTQEAIKSNDPENPAALDLFYDYYAGKEDYVKAEEYLKKLEKFYGADDRDVILKKIRMAGFNKKQVELIQLAEAAYSKYPDDNRFVEYKYLIEAQVRKNNKAAIEVLKKYLNQNSDLSAASSLADIYFKMGKVEDGIKVFENEIAYDPVAVGVYSKLSEIYVQLQNYAKAEEYLKKAIAIAPYSASYHSRLAKIHQEQGKKDLAAKEYRYALSLYPPDYTSIQELRKLENKKDVHDYFQQHNVSDIVAKAPKASDYPDDDVLILTENKQAIIYPSGASEERHMMLAKILNSSGLEKWKEYAAGVNGWQSYIIEDSEVIKANGTKVKGEVNNNEMVFTNLEVGDCIYVRYKLYNYSKGKLANKFWDTFYFSHYYPYLHSSYSVLVAKGQPLNFTFSKKDVELKKTSADDFDLYHWELKNQPSFKYEDKMPAFDDVSNVLHLSTIPDWTFISNWYDDLASAKARPDYEVKQAVKSIFDGKKYSDTQKAQMIYDYITRNITYSSVSFRQSGIVPQNPSTVLTTRIGDCKDVSTLFLAMAREVGLDAQLVLVSTKDNGMRSLMLPSINFNHCMVRVNTDGKVRYLELTSNYLPFSSFGSGSINSVILDIDSKSNKKEINFLNPDTRKLNTIHRTTKISVDNEDLVVNERNSRVGALSGYIRESYINLSDKDRSKSMQEALTNWMPTAELLKLSFGNLANSENRDTVYTNIDYKIKGEVKSIGGLTIISLPWTDKALASDIKFSTSPRMFPIDLSQLYGVDNETEEMTFSIPAGKTIIENVAPISLSDEFLDYNLSVKNSGKTITYTRTIKIKNPYIPAEKAAEFNSFYKKVIAADAKQIALR